MDNFLSKLDFGKTAVISIFIINITCPGFISIACFYPELFAKLDIFKLLILSVSVSFPFLIITICIHIAITSKPNRRPMEDAQPITLMASIINTCHWILLGLICIVYNQLFKAPKTSVMTMIIIFGSVFIYLLVFLRAVFKIAKTNTPTS